jgi:folate-binding protein YgfZ
MSLRTPLYSIAQALKARFTNEAGWEIPASFSIATKEYHSARTGCVIFDQSHHGKIEVAGEDAPSFLHNLSTNDIENLPLGGGCEAYFCDHRAKVLNHALIYHVMNSGRHALHLDVTPGYKDKLLQHLDKYHIAEKIELGDRTSQYAQFHLTGPTASVVLERCMNHPVPNLSEFMHMEREIGGVVTQIRRHDPCGMNGFDLLCPIETCDRVFTSLMQAGAIPCGSETFEVLRIENATPIYGIDIGEDRFVMEVARALRAVSYNKGCYIGQEPIVMSRDRAGFVNRTFLGLKVLQGDPPPSGSKLTRDGQEVGVITSGTFSPRLNAGLVLGYIRRGHQDAGTILHCGEQTFEVLPFPPVTL